MAFGSGDVGLHAPVQKLPLLALGGGQIVEDIGAGEIVELVLPDVGVDRHQGMGTDSVLVSRRHTPGENPLALSLAASPAGNRTSVAGTVDRFRFVARSS